MSNKGKAYCGSCGNWAEDCQTIIEYGAPEKVCKDCRTAPSRL